MSRRRKSANHGPDNDDTYDDHGFVFKPAKSLKSSAKTPKPHPTHVDSPVKPPPRVLATPHPSLSSSSSRNNDRRKTTAASILPSGPLDLRIEVLRPRRSLAPPPRSSALGPNDYTADLPLTGDTPMIARNKSMREGSGGGGGRRRSSLGMRGKRISSAHNGLCPPPHETIDPTDFYRHIDAELSDPNRMRQLLVWCAQRSLGSADSPSTKLDSILAQILREVQKDVIHGLTSKQINTSWYHRPADPLEHVESPVKKLPHPQNIANAQKLVEYNCELDRLRREEDTWNALLANYAAHHSPTPSSLRQQRKEQDAAIAKGDDDANRDVLTRADKAALAREQPGVHARKVDEWIETTFADLRIELDATLAALHKVQAFEHRTRTLADGVFDRVLAAYAEKDNKARNAVDPIDVLRLLSSVATNS
ncbi:Mis12-Mtw1 protein family-domain-containing protein [Powellomyces hirtus]|nr:Mis12-Mtw1 protein family-domain-containing protein [Powellomyces hirtus]